jgi:hypothetical protein
LPFLVKIITHPDELRTKNTGVQAKLLAPRHVELLPFDQVCNERLDRESCALLFPSDEAIKPDELDLTKVRTVYIIDRCEL